MPDEDAVRLGRVVPVLVISRGGDHECRWRAIPGVEKVLPDGVDPETACRALEAMPGAPPPAVSGGGLSAA